MTREVKREDPCMLLEESGPAWCLRMQKEMSDAERFLDSGVVPADVLSCVLMRTCDYERKLECPFISKADGPVLRHGTYQDRLERETGLAHVQSLLTMPSTVSEKQAG